MNARYNLLNAVEQLIVLLLEDFITTGNSRLRLANDRTWWNYKVSDDDMLRIRNDEDASYIAVKHIGYNNASSRNRFSINMYVLAQGHRHLLFGGSCTSRELFYKNTLLIRNQVNVDNAIRDVCSVLQINYWDLGIITSTKGLIAGALKIFISNGDVIDCQAHEGATIIPHLTIIDYMETNAMFVLIVEKDTVFSNLITQNILNIIGTNIILVTGKGYPDICTRAMVRRLHMEFQLPIYVLVDADPFGVEIMLVYRHGSRNMAYSVDVLACPQIRWIGVHPSELQLMNIPTVTLNNRDRKKVAELLSREYLSSGIRRELQILQHLQRKAEIENISYVSDNFLINDYIPNKIKRNLVI